MFSILHKIKYPKLIIYAGTLILAGVFFYFQNLPVVHETVISAGYFGTLIAGIFYAYSFTAAPAMAVLLILAKDQSIITAVLIGGIGAMLGNILVFYFARHSFHHFHDEVDRLFEKNIVERFKSKFLKKEKNLIFIIISGLLIASPIPDEIGVALMASTSSISFKYFTLFAFLLNVVGILLILSIGKLI